MSNNTKRKSLIAIVGCLIISFILGGCSFGLERDYCDDIIIQLEDRDAELIIREWAFLLGSGAEVYYKTDDDEILLGQLSGADNGYCPFKDGQYSVSVDDNQVTIEWSAWQSHQERPWETETFELPANTEDDDKVTFWVIAGIVSAVIFIGVICIFKASKAHKTPPKTAGAVEESPTSEDDSQNE